MAKLNIEGVPHERVVVEIETVYNLQLSREELEGLADVLWCGISGGVVEYAHLDDVLKILELHHKSGRIKFNTIGGINAY